ncbi:MAG: class II glutamine amidotransferase [Puniceicoccaceae bacterium]
MSEPIKHECGLAIIRLRQPLEYYYEKYGTPLWGFYKLFLLMEKQHNRGQDGAGVGAVKLGVSPGQAFMFRERSIKSNPLDRIFKRLLGDYERKVSSGDIHPEFISTVRENFDFAAEALIGHLRYATSGGYNQGACHPYTRRSNWPTRNLMLAGNFNMTNTPSLNQRLIERGQHPIFGTDTQTILEEIGFHLDEEHDRLYHYFRDVEGLEGVANSARIARELRIENIIRPASASWDGGYAIGGLTGSGEAFATRDPWGIRPLHYFIDSEVVAIASERAPLMTVFDRKVSEVEEIPPGQCLIIDRAAETRFATVRPPQAKSSCTFERIYFSRGNDPEIYAERKRLGAALVPRVIESIGDNFEDVVFSYIPNTAEIAYYGFMQQIRSYRRRQVKEEILQAAAENRISPELLDRVIMGSWPISEKVAHKDIKLRTFITQEKERTHLASHVYDISYGTVEPGQTLVCLDDSIVRGTTLRRSIIQILSRLKPRHILIASTAPQIRYPDCYGIDMSQLGKFIAFQAAVALHQVAGHSHILSEIYEACLAQQDQPLDQPIPNQVRRLYSSFSEAQISAKVAELITPEIPDWDGRVSILYQTIPDLLSALPEHTGSWYFTGEYPTPGGFHALNNAFINFYENRISARSY